MVSYKLIYFDIKARGETSRILFAVAGVDCEDYRIDPGDRFIPESTWMTQIKPNAPFGRLPLLEVDGKVICQSRAIERYLARQFGLAGRSPWDQARVDMIVECIEDFLEPLIVIMREKDEPKKSVLKKDCVEIKLPSFLKNFERILEENDGGDGYFVGNEMTLADISFYFNTGYYAQTIIEDEAVINWDEYPKLKALRNKVETHPKVNDWLKRRPVTLY